MFASERDVWSYSSSTSETRTYSPGPPLTPMELRKMSLLSSISVTIPLDQDFNVRAVSPTGCRLSPEHILPKSGKIFLLKFKPNIKPAIRLCPPPSLRHPFIHIYAFLY